jgi:two-component sensor histidine kinase
LSLSLVFHELESNALKYGALSNDTGGVEVSWHVEEKDGACCLKLQWREQGGPPVAPPSRQGFGSRLISKAIGRRFNGKSEAEFAPEGLRWRLSASLEALAN